MQGNQATILYVVCIGCIGHKGSEMAMNHHGETYPVAMTCLAEPEMDQNAVEYGREFLLRTLCWTSFRLGFMATDHLGGYSSSKKESHIGTLSPSVSN